MPLHVLQATNAESFARCREVVAEIEKHEKIEHVVSTATEVYVFTSTRPGWISDGLETRS